MNDEPLIYTTLGNVPVASLVYSHWWEEDGVAITLIEEYKKDGIVVRRNAHVRLKQSMDAVITNQLMNAAEEHTNG